MVPEAVQVIVPGPLVDTKITRRASRARWGPLLRAGNDKSYLARQVERYADIYMSRVSNFLFQTPQGYLRSPRGSLPHDPDIPAMRAASERD